MIYTSIFFLPFIYTNLLCFLYLREKFQYINRKQMFMVYEICKQYLNNTIDFALKKIKLK